MQHIKDRLLTLVKEKAGGMPSVFAKKAGIPHSTFYGYLKGRGPHSEHLLRIHNEFNVNINWLLTGNGKRYIDDKDSVVIYEYDETSKILDKLDEIILNPRLHAIMRALYIKTKIEKDSLNLLLCLFFLKTKKEVDELNIIEFFISFFTDETSKSINSNNLAEYLHRYLSNEKNMDIDSNMMEEWFSQIKSIISQNKI